MWNPDVILIGPAGAKAFLLMGVLKKLFQEPDFFKNVHTWAGVSAGAAISLLLSIGYTIQDIEDLSMDINIVEDIININLDEARQKLGLIKNKTLEDTLKKAIIKKVGFIPTMKQLYLITGVNLVLISFNLDTYKTEFFSKDSEPDLSCLEAVMMSMTVPVLIQPRKYKGSTYVDGAVAAPYPVLHFDKNNDKVLGIYVSSEQDLYTSDKAANYIFRLVQSGMRTIRHFNIEYSSDNVKHIPVQTNIKDVTGLSISKEVREQMIEYGYRTGENFLKINENPEKYDINLKDNEEIPFEL